MERREFIGSLSASIAVIAVGCTRPEEKLMSPVHPSAAAPVGDVSYYNTVFPLQNIPYGITVKTQDGRPVKIDGNPEHPLSKGRSTALIQASLYSLYDPDRFWSPEISSNKVNIQTAINELKKRIEKADSKAIIHFLINETNSQIVNKLIEEIEEKNSNVKFHFISQNRNKDTDELLQALACEDSFKSLQKYFSFGADFLSKGNTALASSVLWHLNETMFTNKLYVAEPYLSQTGLKANYRESLNLNELEIIIRLFYNELHSINSNEYIKYNYLKKTKFWDILTDTLVGTTPACFIPGEYLSEEAQAMVFSFNYESIKRKRNLRKSNQVSTFPEFQLNDLIIFCNVNPYYFLNDMSLKNLNSISSKNKINISTIFNETSYYSDINIPMTSYLENWDVHSMNELTSIQQPVVNKLHPNSISCQDLLLRVFSLSSDDNLPIDNYYSYIRSNVKFSENEWIEVLQKGFYKNELIKYESYSKKNKVNANFINNFVESKDLLFLGIPSPYFQYGLETNNPYLHELPDPITKISWGNSAIMSENSAKAYNLEPNDIIRITSKNGEIELPVLIFPGISDNLIISYFGYGRKGRANICNDLGANIFKILDNYNDLKPVSINIKRTGHQKKSSQLQNLLVLKNISSKNNISNSKPQNPSLKSEISIYPKYEYLRIKWGMLIDTNKCTGCNACVAACQIENNIPVIGSEEFEKNRSMQWIKINTYLDVNEKSIKGKFEPLMCQQCENAPCESVCPVGASSHSPEGLNEMTYNRCIGARYCMVNCPYKVRSFNLKDYTKNIRSPLQLILNKNVTVRSIGIAEKCTFCVHRINEARTEGKDSLKSVTTACQQACPMGAITFGNLLDTSSIINKQIKSNISKSYKLLESLNTLPSVTYIE